MDLRGAFEALQTELATPPWADEVERARQAFALRTGAFASDDAWFEARSRAFWDDATTSGGLGRRARDRLAEDERPFVDALARAHRGLFVAAEVPKLGGDDDSLELTDLWSGARFRATGLDPGTDDALAYAEGAFDARVVVVASPSPTAPFAAFVLPGAVFHPPEALPLLEPLLAEADGRGMDAAATFDAVLRMELAHRKATRMKAAYAYRAAALAPPAPASSGRLPLSGKWAMR